MKEMIKKYRGSLICSVLVMLIGVLVGFTSIAYSKFMWKIISQAHPFCMSNDILPDVR